MKSTRNFFLLLLFTAISTALVASPLATFNYKVFFVPNKGPVVETYFDISGKSIVLQEKTESTIYGQVELTLLFKQGEDIATYDKKVIQSPEMKIDNVVDFIDVQRFALPSGTYTLEIILKDLFDPAGIDQISEVEVVVPNFDKNPSVSDIELVSAYKEAAEPGILTKSGYDMLPMVSDDFLNPEMKELVFYAELYGMDQVSADQPMFLIKYFMEDTATGVPVESTVKYLRREAADVNPVFARIPLDDVESGHYNIVVEARNTENELLVRQERTTFRKHPGKSQDLNEIDDDKVEASWVSSYNNKGELFEYLKSLRPISSQKEQYQLDNTFGSAEKTELKYMQRFFYAFWKSRNELDSQNEWLEYRQQVNIAQKKFGTPNKRGYETDRGRVFLRYGPPNDITDRPNEPSSYPYQIWRYYKADKFNNVKFVFYDPMVMAIDYELLHCEYIPGERQQYNWRLLLEQRNTPMNNIDRESGRDHFGGRIDDYYQNPR